MLSLGLTGGIAAGKSLVAARLAELGAVLIDADRLAREVVEPGTEGLAEVAAEFGPAILNPEGGLDREALGSRIFADAAQREKLNAIVHPRVRARATELRASAPPDAIVVQDIPLLVETGQGAAFHLVLVVDAPAELRIERMVRNRGLTEAAATQRIAAQASQRQRLAAADVVIENSGPAELTLEAVDTLWQERLLPFAENLHAGATAKRSGPAILKPADPGWSAAASRLIASILDTAGEKAIGADHIGSTSIPGLAAKDVIDLQLRVDSLASADELALALSAAGFPRIPGTWSDTPSVDDPDPRHWQKRLHGNSDPGRAVNLHIRVDGSPGANYALAFRDWLRSEPEWREIYLGEKLRAAALHGTGTSADYAQEKENWFSEIARPALEEWKTRSGWTPPRV